MMMMMRTTATMVQMTHVNLREHLYKGEKGVDVVATIYSETCL